MSLFVRRNPKQPSNPSTHPDKALSLRSEGIAISLPYHIPREPLLPHPAENSLLVDHIIVDQK